MNERIKEFARKAGISILYEYDGYDGHAAVANLTDIEKFAELIVLECVASIEKTININCETDSAKMGCEFAITDLKEHFGVK